jgi:tripeptide aminopeptidase
MLQLSELIQNYTFTSRERFLAYVQIDTQSDPHSPTSPSTEKQKNLGKVLVSELQALGIENAHLDEHGYVYAQLESNVHTWIHLRIVRDPM